MKKLLFLIMFVSCSMFGQETLPAGSTKIYGFNYLAPNGDVYLIQGATVYKIVKNADLVTALALKQNQLNGTGIPLLNGTTLSYITGNSSQFVRPDGSVSNFANSVIAVAIAPDPGTNTPITSTTAIGAAIWQVNRQINNFVAKANTTNITATTTVTTSQFGNNGFLYLNVNATSGAVTVNLPAASTWVGYTLFIIKTDSSVNGITVDANGSELINQNLTFPINTQNANAGFYSDGTTIRVLN